MLKRQKFILMFLGLIGLVLLVVYGSTFSADFLPWDDDYNISQNPIYTRGSWLSFWTRAFYGMYIPVTNSIWGLLFEAGHGTAFPFRVFNFSLHLFNVLLVALFLDLILKKLKIEDRWLWSLGVALFALHPLQVETVAWISGGRDLLSTTCALVALLVYFRFPNRKGFALGGFLFILGLLSKPQVAALPVAILFLQALISSDLKTWRRTAIQMSLWSLPVLAIVLLTFQEQKNYVNLTVGIWQRLLVILDSYGFYLAKIIFPVHLMVDYGRTPQMLTENFQEHWWAALFFILTLSFFAFLFLKKEKKRELLAFGIWIACLLPVSGIVDFAFQEISTTADHYVYFPMLAFSLLLIVSFAGTAKGAKQIKGPAIVVISLLWASLSWSRAQVWQNRFVFFDEMLKSNPQSYSALMGTGGNAALNKDNQKALLAYKKALAQRPGDVAAMANTLSTLFRLRSYADVMKHEDFLFTDNFRKTLEIRHIAAANLLTTFGSAAYVLNQLELSRLYICKAYQVNPYSPNIQNARSELLQILERRGLPHSCADELTDEEFFRAIAGLHEPQAK